MKISCTGRKVALKDAFLERVDARLAKLDKFFSPDVQAQVTVTVEKDWQTVELTVKDKGFMMRAEKSAERMEDAFDAAVEVLTRRIIKNRKRLDTRVCQPAVEAVANPRMSTTSSARSASLSSPRPRRKRSSK